MVRGSNKASKRPSLMLDDLEIDEHSEDFDGDPGWDSYEDFLHRYYREKVVTRRREICMYVFKVLSVMTLTSLLIVGVVVMASTAITFSSGKEGFAAAPTITTKMLPSIEVIRDACSSPSSSSSETNSTTEIAKSRKCDVICRNAKCCHIPIGTPGSCFQSDKDVCDESLSHYCLSSLSSLEQRKDAVVPPVPHVIEEKCGSLLSPPPNTTDDGRIIPHWQELSECYELCLPARCCTSLEGNCMRNNVETCLRYATFCGQFVGDENVVGSSTTGRSDFAKEVCTNDNARQSSGERFCWVACTPAACCFPRVFGGEESSCEGGGGVTPSLKCEDYNFCNILPEMEEEMDDYLTDDHFILSP